MGDESVVIGTSQLKEGQYDILIEFNNLQKNGSNEKIIFKKDCFTIGLVQEDKKNTSDYK